MAHGGGSSISMAMSTGSAPGGRRSSSTFDRKSGDVGGRRSSGDGGLRTNSGAFQGSRHATAPTGRGSTESAYSEQTSGRSSFAMEQEPAQRHAASSADSAARPSIESFGFPPSCTSRPPAALAPMTFEQLQAMCLQIGVPPAMHARFLRLATLHPSLPVPMRALVRACCIDL